MNVPVLRKTIRLPNLPTASVPIRPIVTLDKRRVDLPTALRLLQRQLNLFLRTEYRSIINFRYSTLLPRLVNRRIHQILFRTITRSLRSTSPAGTFRRSLFTERLQNRLFVRFVFVARYQPRRLEIQAFRRFLHQQFRVLFRSFAVDDFQHEFVFGIKGDVIPIVAATGVRRIIFVATFLFLPHKVPLFVELNLLGLWGKNPRVRRGELRRVRLQVLCNDLPSRDRLSGVVLFFAFRHRRRRVRGWRWRFLPAGGSRTKRFHVVRKSVVYKSSSTVIGCRLVRRRPERGYFFRPEHRVGDIFYSDSKTYRDRP